MNEPIIAQFRLPITEKETVQELMQKGVDWGKTIGAIEELEKIKAEIGKEFVDLQDGSEEWRSYVNESVLSCYEIVEKHISELKGE